MDMDVLGFRFADGEFVAADSNFNGISQGGDFADENLRSLGAPMSMMRLLTGPSPASFPTVTVSPIRASLNVRCLVIE